MISTRAAIRGPTTSKRATAQLIKSFQSYNAGFRPTFVAVQYFQSPVGQRLFSSSPNGGAKIVEFFEKHPTEKVRKTHAAWPHPVYTEEQMNQVTIAHREAKTMSDKVALIAVKILRWGLDKATGYKHQKAVDVDAKDPLAKRKAFAMNEEKYLIRNVFLESVAGVPGMVAGMLRHLHSMRRMKRDNGWIESLLEESYNERMHLLVFLKMQKPGRFMRLMVLGAQGVWCNALFFAYLLSPRTVHRFVGYLEEEAVITYTRQIEDLDAGRLPKWAKMEAPEIAVDYWQMPEGHRTMRDLLLYIRADESKHREVNHTFGNLDQKEDPNPYVSEYRNPEEPHPTKDLAHMKPTGWERHEII
ncbi:Alternative oxidase, mitochondrial precursor [Alternaria arbusti]|uniref:Alternative oxidase, mitochondrial precursor n=1 Tax=Alternaria arbusti TaxID=232088 RepID=UPI00221FB0D2|nr:Alternative oxidase, mitochondrial precursor [Alternaria arbusti]KAI4942348.1 Alternative oxidase, mitochondrial precursor [Alternaria arbusti]